MVVIPSRNKRHGIECKVRRNNVFYFDFIVFYIFFFFSVLIWWSWHHTASNNNSNNINDNHSSCNKQYWSNNICAADGNVDSVLSHNSNAFLPHTFTSFRLCCPTNVFFTPTHLFAQTNHFCAYFMMRVGARDRNWLVFRLLFCFIFASSSFCNGRFAQYA